MIDDRYRQGLSLLRLAPLHGEPERERAVGDLIEALQLLSAAARENADRRPALQTAVDRATDLLSTKPEPRASSVQEQQLESEIEVAGVILSATPPPPT